MEGIFYICKVNQKTNSMYEKILESLKLFGFDNTDYILSLQGPTVIFTVSGTEKLKIQPEVKDILTKMGAEIMC